MIHITAHLDGSKSQGGYTYIITKSATSWKAFKTAKGFKYFLDSIGLKIDAQHTELRDYRQYGQGRCITMICKEKNINEHYFYHAADVPKEAKAYIGIVNAEYVQCYALDTGDSVEIYRPNPNAKEVYKPLDYFAMNRLIG